MNNYSTFSVILLSYDSLTIEHNRVVNGSHAIVVIWLIQTN